MGQASDYAALAVAERVQIPTGRYITLPGETEIVATGPNRYPELRPVAVSETVTELHVRHLHRWDIGTSYVRIVDETMELIAKLLAMHDAEETEARAKAQPGYPWESTATPILAVDHTGVGIAVVDQFRAKPVPIAMIAITITAGIASHGKPQPDNAYRPWTVPKPELVAPMLVAVQNGRLKVGEQVPLAGVLGKEMAAFRMKVRAGGGVSYEHVNEKEHDDLVLAVSLATWVAHKIDQQTAGVYR